MKYMVLNGITVEVTNPIDEAFYLSVGYQYVDKPEQVNEPVEDEEKPRKKKEKVAQ